MACSPSVCVVSDSQMGSCLFHRVTEGQLLLFDLLRKHTLVNIFPLCRERCPKFVWAQASLKEGFISSI